MAKVNPSLRRASPSDAPPLLVLMRDYYAEDGYPFDGAKAEGALLSLLTEPALGEAWLVEQDGIALGYVVICFGWSLEYQGRDAFLDEVFVARGARGQGLGRRLVDHAVARCRDLGVKALHLEVERAKEATMALYRRLGFHDSERRLMTRRLDGPAGPGPAGP